MANQTEAAKALGKSQVAIHNAIKSGRLKKSVRRRGKSYDINIDLARIELAQNTNPDAIPGGEANKKKFVNKKKPSLAPKPKSKPKLKPSKPKPLPTTAPEEETIIRQAGLSTASYTETKMIKTKLEAALLKLKLDNEQGKVVPVDKVKKEWFELGRLTRDNILSIPDRIAPILAAEKDQHVVNKLMTDELIKALERIADDES